MIYNGLKTCIKNINVYFTPHFSSFCLNVSIGGGCGLNQPTLD